MECFDSNLKRLSQVCVGDSMDLESLFIQKVIILVILGGIVISKLIFRSTLKNTYGSWVEYGLRYFIQFSKLEVYFCDSINVLYNPCKN